MNKSVLCSALCGGFGIFFGVFPKLNVGVIRCTKFLGLFGFLVGFSSLLVDEVEVVFGF